MSSLSKQLTWHLKFSLHSSPIIKWGMTLCGFAVSHLDESGHVMWLLWTSSASTHGETWGDITDTEVNAVISALSSCIRCTISELVKEQTLPSRVCYISRLCNRSSHDSFNSTVYARQHTIPGDFFGSSCYSYDWVKLKNPCQSLGF